MPPTFGMPTLATIVSKLEKNDPKDTTLDISKNASIRMKPASSIAQVCEALSHNTSVQAIIMRECEVTDKECVSIADMLIKNQKVSELDLQQNAISSAGATELARGLSKNTSLRTLNLLRQNVMQFGEDTLTAYVTMFDTNTTLTKIMWSVSSTKSWAIAKLLTRNVEIQRRQIAGMDYTDLYPMPLNKIPITEDEVEKVRPLQSDIPEEG